MPSFYHTNFKITLETASGLPLMLVTRSTTIPAKLGTQSVFLPFDLGEMSKMANVMRRHQSESVVLKIEFFDGIGLDGDRLEDARQTINTANAAAKTIQSTSE